MKLIIDIPDNEYQYTCDRTLHDRSIWDYAIRNGVPLDDVKAEIAEQMETEFLEESTIGMNFGLRLALEIIDNIDKAESEVQE